jgi:hypothetical protein
MPVSPDAVTGAVTHLLQETGQRKWQAASGPGWQRRASGLKNR